MENQNTGKKSGAIACGVISLVLGVIGMFVWYLAVPALVLGIVAVALASASSKLGVPATGGMVTGILGIVFSGIGIACWIACVDALNDLENMVILFWH